MDENQWIIPGFEEEEEKLFAMTSKRERKYTKAFDNVYYNLQGFIKRKPFRFSFHGANPNIENMNRELEKNAHTL